MKILQTLALLALSIFLSVAPLPALADSWLLPTTTTYTSSAGHARIRISPRELKSQSDYFDDKVQKIEPAGQQSGGATFASARLERLLDGRWQSVWEHQIANDVSPVSALVRDDGAYTVTFDDWHGIGYGPNVVVIYGAEGRIVRALSLSDIVPSDYIQALPHSVSSIHWRGDPRLSSDGQRVLIPVIIPSEDYVSNPATVEIGLNLADGKVSPIYQGAWDVAQATARKVLAGLVAYETATKAAFFAPLLGPTANTEPAWHDYLREAVGRLIGDEETPSTTVLRLPGSNDYAVSEMWVREALTESYADNVALASLSEPNLLTVLKKVVSKLPDRSLSNVTAFIVMSDQNWPEVVATMRRSGAKVVQLDPTEPIPQRPERIQRRYGQADTRLN